MPNLQIFRPPRTDFLVSTRTFRYRVFRCRSAGPRRRSAAGRASVFDQNNISIVSPRPPRSAPAAVFGRYRGTRVFSHVRRSTENESRESGTRAVRVRVRFARRAGRFVGPLSYVVIVMSYRHFFFFRLFFKYTVLYDGL